MRAFSSVFRFLALVLTVSVLGGCGSESSFTILHFGDLHGHLHPLKRTEGKTDIESGGIARLIGGLKAAKQAAGPDSLILYNGDTIQGTTFSTFFKGEVSFGLLDGVIDYMVPGVHDFDYGQQNFINLTGKAKFKVLSANIFNKDAKPFTGSDYVIKDFNGIKVGIFGLTVRITEILQPTRNIDGLTFGAVEEAARSMVQMMRSQGVDFIVALTHQGLEEDKKLARAVDGINLIVGGLSHTILTNGFLVFDTWIAHAGYRGEHFGSVTVRYDKGKKQILSVTTSVVDVTPEIPADPEVAKVVEKYTKELKSKLDVVVSKTDVLLEGSRNKVRGNETNLGNLLADVLQRETGAEMCLINSGVIRASINPGPIKIADVLNVLPYPNNVSTVRLSGKTIYRIIEKSAATNPGEGRFLQVSRGLQYKIRGRTLAELKFNGKDIEENRIYTVATSDFLADGGDNYPEFKQERERKNTGITMAEFMIEALKRMPNIDAKVEGRIVRIEG
ncbi:MAG TPA: bifunctional UDP-sugar hydrolase/5'-nucleotidase [Spirochaetota bacterium]|mgnify:CR=1 FL=1|nr:bifunctional UDP-sugar hydrolase/5'-nucleotidase [Spirochaetota bacterium]